MIGAALKVAGARSFAAARWTIPYSYTASPAANVKGVGHDRGRPNSGTDFEQLGDAYGSGSASS